MIEQEEKNSLEYIKSLGSDKIQKKILEILDQCGGTDEALSKIIEFVEGED